MKTKFLIKIYIHSSNFLKQTSGFKNIESVKSLNCHLCVNNKIIIEFKVQIMNSARRFGFP